MQWALEGFPDTMSEMSCQLEMTRLSSCDGRSGEGIHEENVCDDNDD